MNIEDEIQRLTEKDSPAGKAAIAHAVHTNVANWNELLRKDPELAKLEIGIAHCARILVTEGVGSPQFAQALAEDRVLRDRRHALWRRRAEAPQQQVAQPQVQNEEIPF